MSDFNNEIAEWLLQHGWTGWSILLGLIAFGVVYSWLVKAEPVNIIRGMLNFKRRRLEDMLMQQFTDPKVHELVRLELNQHTLYKLTGLRDHRLQKEGVLFLSRFNLRARYLVPWCNWLTEKDGRIKFNNKRYRFAWRFFLWVLLPVPTLLLIFITIAFIEKYGLTYAPVFMMLNITLWWFPLLYVSTIPNPARTEEMENRIRDYNNEKDLG